MPDVSGRELTALVAALMAINALSIDVMLPALPEIAASLHVARDNDRQLIIVAYVMASGVAQLGYGPLADAFGRRRVLLAALCGGILGSIGCACAPSFTVLLASRALQGVCAASTRVISTALVRDLVAGPRMAQIMSSAMMVFLVVPILAPSLGQLILSFGPWRWLFVMLSLAFAGLAAWIAARLPETLPPARRIPLRVGALLSAYAQVLRTRVTMGYTLALAIVFAAMFSFLTSAQQIFVEVFALGRWFALAFASVGCVLACAQFANVRWVMRVGMRRLSHRALLAYVGITSLHALTVALLGAESVWLFFAFLWPSLFVFGFLGPNFGAIAMEPVGQVAGSAAALNGFLATVGGALLGGFVGRSFDGSTKPFVYGQALLGLAALGLVFVTEHASFARRGASSR
jgi:DHA1 family bicyclomycin/chloramphenicol resistance-like MFS transporter